MEPQDCRPEILTILLRQGIKRKACCITWISVAMIRFNATGKSFHLPLLLMLASTDSKTIPAVCCFLLISTMCRMIKCNVHRRVCMCVHGVSVYDYLAEGQTVFILVFIFDLKVVQCFALGGSLAQRTQ